MAVVGDHDRHAVALLEQRPEAEVGPVEVHRPADGPRARVDDAGRADADPEEGGPVIGAQGVDKLEDELDGGFAVPSFEGQVDRAEDLAAQVDDGAAELRLAEVEPDQVAAVGGDAQQDRRLAAARAATTDLLDQALVDERADEVADRGSRQAGEPGQVGARERAVIVEGAQDQLLIERSRLLVRGLSGSTVALALIRAGHSSDRDRPVPCRVGFGKRLDKVGWCDASEALSRRWTNRIRYAESVPRCWQRDI